MLYLAVSPKFSVTATVNETNTTKGSSVSFACFGDGGPNNVIVWILTDSSIDLESIPVLPPLNVSEEVGFFQKKYVVLQHSNHGYYVIDSVNATEDGGIYTCVVINVGGMGLDEVQLLVQPTITRQPENVLTSNGEIISLRCEADSFPPTTYSWFLETTEQEVLVTENAPRVTMNNTGKYLLFSGVDYSDAGSYFCRANSSSGYADSRVATITGTYTLITILCSSVQACYKH